MMFRVFLLNFFLIFHLAFAGWPPEGVNLSEEEQQQLTTILQKAYEGECFEKTDQPNLKKFAEMGHPDVMLYYGEYLFFNSISLQEAAEYVFKAAPENSYAQSLIQSVLEKENPDDSFPENFKNLPDFKNFIKQWPVAYQKSLDLIEKEQSFETYDVKQIASWLIENIYQEGEKNKADPSEIEICNLKLQKILYYAQTCSMQALGRPLFAPQQIEAWDYGPVIPSIYSKYQNKGQKTSILRESSEKSSLENLQLDEDANLLLQAVLREVNEKSAFCLVRWTHGEGMPWKIFYEKKEEWSLSPNIPECVLRFDHSKIVQNIRRFFEELKNPSSASDEPEPKKIKT